jgi:hypothetical protein
MVSTHCCGDEISEMTMKGGVSTSLIQCAFQPQTESGYVPQPIVAEYRILSGPDSLYKELN